MNALGFDAEKESGNDDRRRWNDAVLNDDDMISVWRNILRLAPLFLR